MFIYHKRKLLNILAIILAGIFCLFGYACSENNNSLPLSDNGNPFFKEQEFLSYYSVDFLDVGDSDCIFIKLPDNKTVLIDCGENNQEVYEKVEGKLKTQKVTKIDYLILTHPDVEHIANATKILDDFKVEKLFAPKLPDYLKADFLFLEEIIEKANQKSISVYPNEMLTTIVGEDYFMAYLSPTLSNFDEYNPYNQILLNPQSDQAVNDLSPIIYFECKGVRFLFTGDASSNQEEFVLQNYNMGYYDKAFKNIGKTVNLKDLDFLKVSHHGWAKGTSEQLLSLTLPKYAIISVGAYGGNPSTSTLERILKANQDCQILRTDVLTDICVKVDSNGKIRIN